MTTTHIFEAQILRLLSERGSVSQAWLFEKFGLAVMPSLESLFRKGMIRPSAADPFTWLSNLPKAHNFAPTRAKIALVSGGVYTEVFATLDDDLIRAMAATVRADEYETRYALIDARRAQLSALLNVEILAGSYVWFS